MWSRSGNELFYRTEDNRLMVSTYTVVGDSFVAGKPRLWSDTRLVNMGLTQNFDLAPDGKRFAVLMSAEGTEPRETQHMARAELLRGSATARGRWSKMSGENPGR